VHVETDRTAVRKEGGEGGEDERRKGSQREEGEREESGEERGLRDRGKWRKRKRGREKIIPWWTKPTNTMV